MATPPRNGWASCDQGRMVSRSKGTGRLVATPPKLGPEGSSNPLPPGRPAAEPTRGFCLWRDQVRTASSYGTGSAHRVGDGVRYCPRDARVGADRSGVGVVRMLVLPVVPRLPPWI